MRAIHLALITTLLLSVAGLRAPEPAAAAGPALPYSILFVTQAPIRADFTTIGST
ncbi:MAG: hypothetical protein ACT4QE_06445 [Anaerolineales bacterium]